MGGSKIYDKVKDWLLKRNMVEGDTFFVCLVNVKGDKLISSNMLVGG